MIKRCFLCAHKENADGTCTNQNCPRYASDTDPEATTTKSTETAEA